MTAGAATTTAHVPPNGPRIICAFKYGSLARGEQDESSDEDCCLVISGDRMNDDLPLVPAAVSSAFNSGRPDYTWYSEADFLRTTRNGSLFAWHLRLESVRIFGTAAAEARLFQDLVPYARWLEDIATYEELFLDASASLGRRGPNPFDLALLFTIARNTAMVLSTVDGTPAFGRMSVFSVCRDRFGAQFRFEPKVYEDLCRWKLWHSRGTTPEPALTERRRLSEMLQHLAALIAFTKEMCDAT